MNRCGPLRRPPNGEGLRSATFYGRFRRYLEKAGLPPAGLHILRHTAAKLRRDAGESIEDVSRFLDHSSLAVTTTYLRRLGRAGRPGLGQGGGGDRTLGWATCPSPRKRSAPSPQ